MHLERRVVITGLGALSPLGNSAQISWDACLKGTSGIQKISTVQEAVNYINSNS